MDSTSKPTLLHLLADAVVEQLMQSGQLADLEHADLDTMESEVIENIDELTRGVLSKLLGKQAELTAKPDGCPKCQGPLRCGRFQSLTRSIANTLRPNPKQQRSPTKRKLAGGSTDLDALLPDRWAAAHPESIRTYRQAEQAHRAAKTKFRRARRRQLSKRQ